MDSKEIMSIDNKIKAAYALNLCTVSVSQIVDYNDINVLEQEYEAILNNLNLEHMPHDEALLLILKQLLDTITFFRIQEGDKKIMELRYREKMRNAIWNAVPNFGLIVAGGNPITIAISLASQVGIGYMNYRKEKANNELDYEEEKWKLQRVALEQFNGLRRELFDTAWRLADTYGFEDELRLTERQIKHYDSILMDDNALRKYDRLDSIKNSFVAYPPFWYYLGNTANEICRDKTLMISDETRDHFRTKAKDYFSQFWESNKYPLLREDQLASSCALEYVDLLIEDRADKDQIEELIDKAVKYAGNAWDILQLCAIAYLRIGSEEKAIPVLKVLVNEKYNSSVNAQLLSGLYIREYRSGNHSIKSEYESLGHKVSNTAYMIPWPTDENIPEKEFYENQREMLLRRYRQALYSFRDKYTALFNAIIPIPDEELEHAGADYSEMTRDERVSAVEHILASSRKDSFLSTINDIEFGVEYINLLNKMFTSLTALSVITDADALIKMTEDLVSKEAKRIESIQSRIREFSFTDSDYEALQVITSEKFLSDVFEAAQNQLQENVDKLNDMGKLSSTSSEMIEFCHEEGIALPESRADKMQEVMAGAGKQYYLSYKILGDKAEYYSKVLAKKEIMTAIIRKKAEKSLNGGVNMMMVYPGSDTFNDYFSKSNKAVKKYKNEVLAILDDKSFLFDTDLLFTTTGVLIVERNTLKQICSYDSVSFDSKTGKLTLGDMYYHHANVDSRKMYEALVELKHSSNKR